MAHNTSNDKILIREEEEETMEKLVVPQTEPRKYEIVWSLVVVISYSHLGGFYGLYILTCRSVMWQTLAFAVVTYILNVLGITAGAHRLWSHRTYKATIPLQIFLMLCESMASQYSIFNWVQDHRLHHKYSDTDADPHNTTRGFFFSHVGWLLVKKHPEVKKRGRFIDISDLHNNPIVMFQKRYALWMIMFMAFILPTAIPIYFWNESFTAAYHINILRFVCALNAIWSVNSFAHMWGWKPYDKGISPTQNILVTIPILGEGFHNYHHAFPQDYKAGEWGNIIFNFTAVFIDFCALFGLAYDRRSVSDEVVKKRMLKTGDGTDLWANKKIFD